VDRIQIDVRDLPAQKGRTLGPGPWHEIDQNRVNLFAEATGDHQWIHVDVEQAATGPFGGTIAHGYLTLSMLPMLQGELWEFVGASMGVNYGMDKVRFPAPVPIGVRVRLSVEVLDVEERPDGSYLLRNQATIVRENGDRPVCVAQTLAILRPA
jgi:acyl dehydratase